MRRSARSHRRSRAREHRTRRYFSLMPSRGVREASPLSSRLHYFPPPPMTASLLRRAPSWTSVATPAGTRGMFRWVCCSGQRATADVCPRSRLA
jgi:hypothetical protein